MHQNLKLLSYNSQLTLHGCPRKFQLYRLLKKQLAESIDKGSIHLDFGSLVGYGVQEWLIHHDMKKCIFKMLTQYQRDLEEDTEKKQGKTFFHAMIAVEKFPTHFLEEFGDYKLLINDASSAIELGFLIDCGNGFYYRGFMDAILYSESSKRFAVLENKTTASHANEAMWANSNQGLSYSVVLDKIAAAYGFPSVDSYDVIYNVFKTTSREWEAFRVKKNYTEKAEWIQEILLDISILQLYNDANSWPKHGEHCYNFFRQCEYYGICGMSDSYLIGDVDSVEEMRELEESYDFVFSLSELIDTQLEKLEV